MTSIRQAQLFVGATLLLCAQAASAQFVWVNEKGVKQFSDRAPPPSVPLKNILKAPSAMMAAASSAATEQAPDADAKPAAAKPEAPLTTADREAAYRKQKAEQAEKNATAAAMAANEQQRRAACGAAAASRALLDSGVRLRRADQVWLNDQQRAQHSARTNSILEECSRPVETKPSPQAKPAPAKS